SRRFAVAARRPPHSGRCLAPRSARPALPDQLRTRPTFSPDLPGTRGAGWFLAPAAHRLSPRSHSSPAFLICTDEQLDPRTIIETYFQRWDIEVNFRDEKTLLGVGQAQVRCPRSVQSAPALTVASYALLLLATQRAFAP